MTQHTLKFRRFFPRCFYRENVLWTLLEYVLRAKTSDNCLTYEFSPLANCFPFNVDRIEIQVGTIWDFYETCIRIGKKILIIHYQFWTLQTYVKWIYINLRIYLFTMKCSIICSTLWNMRPLNKIEFTFFFF